MCETLLVSRKLHIPMVLSGTKMQYLAGLAINNQFTEYLKQQTTLTVENIVQRWSPRYRFFSWICRTGWAQKSIKLSNATFYCEQVCGRSCYCNCSKCLGCCYQSKTANAVDGIINTTIKFIEQAGVQIAVMDFFHCSCSIGVGFLVAPSQQLSVW